MCKCTPSIRTTYCGKHDFRWDRDIIEKFEKWKIQMKRPVHISLGLEDFIELVRGGIVEQDGARIILKDIGWDNMLYAINKISSGKYSNKSSKEISNIVFSEFFNVPME